MATHKYRQILEKLQSEISLGRYKPGKRLPSEAELGDLAVELGRGVKNVAGVETDLERLTAVVDLQLLHRLAGVHVAHGQRHVIGVDRHLHRPHLFGGDGGDALILVCAAFTPAVGEYARAGRRLHPERPVLLVCTADTNGYVSDAIASGVDDIVTLPPDAEMAEVKDTGSRPPELPAIFTAREGNFWRCGCAYAPRPPKPGI